MELAFYVYFCLRQLQILMLRHFMKLLYGIVILRLHLLLMYEPIGRLA